LRETEDLAHHVMLLQVDLSRLLLAWRSMVGSSVMLLAMAIGFNGQRCGLGHAPDLHELGGPPHDRTSTGCCLRWGVPSRWMLALLMGRMPSRRPGSRSAVE
ncbi:hypothetical protein ACLOJK_029257, partial [Asimina triloba]